MAEKIRAWENLTEEEQKRFIEIVVKQHKILNQQKELESKMTKLDKEKKLLYAGKWLEVKKVK